jgi:hypothetical protein
MFNNQGTVTKINQESYSIKLGDRVFTLSAGNILVAIIVVSVTLRLFSAIYQGNELSNLPGIFDQISYDGLARRVVDGHGFSFAEGHWPATKAGEPTAHWSYLYTIYLAAVYKLFGVYPIIARVIQAVIVGVFQTLLTWRIGRHLFGQKVGLIAAAISAVYIYFFYYAGGLVTESFYIIGILWIFDVTYRILNITRNNQNHRLWWKWFELGLAIGVTVLIRQVFLLFLPFLFFWIWWNMRDDGLIEPNPLTRFKYQVHWTAIKGILIAILILALMIVPWTIRNYQSFETFVLLNTNAGFAFYWGNHPIHGADFVPIQPVTYQDLIPQELLVLNEGKLDRALLQEGIHIVLDDPVRYVLLSISRIKDYIKFWPSRDSGLLSNISRVGSFGVFLPFMLFGLGISLFKLRKPSYTGQRSDLNLIYLFIVIYTSIHLLTWTLIRYRLPIDALLLLFAALSIESIVGKYKVGNRIIKEN